MKKYVFGIDVGGTTIKCGLFSSKGEVLESWEIVTNKADQGNHIISDIAATIQSKCEEKGIQIGIEKGIQQEKIETVLRLKSLGLNTEQIAKGTCITESEVENIIKNNKL